MTALHNVARSLVSMVRSSGIRKDYAIDEDHGGAEPASRDEWAAQPFGLGRCGLCVATLWAFVCMRLVR